MVLVDPMSFLGFPFEKILQIFDFFLSNLSILGEICQFLAPQHIEDKLKESKRKEP